LEAKGWGREGGGGGKEGGGKGGVMIQSLYVHRNKGNKISKEINVQDSNAQLRVYELGFEVVNLTV
jgi:hypothetical protein